MSDFEKNVDDLDMFDIYNNFRGSIEYYVCYWSWFGQTCSPNLFMAWVYNVISLKYEKEKTLGWL